MNRLFKGTLFFLVACLASAASLKAATLDWAYGGVDRWINTAGNWGGTAPTSADALIINNATNSPQADAAHMVAANIVRMGTTASGKLEISGGTLEIGSELRVGYTTGDSSVIMTGGTLHKAGGTSIRFGMASGATGRLTMSGASQFNVDSSNFLFGYTTGSVGYLTMSDTATVNVGGGQTSIGYSGTAHATMSADSVWNQTGGTWVLGYGGGTVADMTMSDQAMVNTAGGTFVGWQGATNATLNMSGTTKIITTGYFQIANSDNLGATTGTVNMTGSASITTAGEGYFAAWGGTNATLNMTDDTVLNTNGALRTGYGGGNAVVNMSGNARLNNIYHITIGDSENYQYGTSKAVWNLSGNAHIEQTNGNIHLGLWNDSYGELNMSDNASIHTNGWTLVIGDSWSDWGTPGTFGTGVVKMTGTSSYINDTGDISVGNNAKGRGTLTIGETAADNPLVKLPGWFYLGSGGGGEGTVNVNYGTVDHTAATGPIMIGRSGSTGVWNQNGGITKDDYGTYVAEQWGRTNGVWHVGNTTLNLNGGTYATAWFRHWDNGVAAGTQLIKLNGGTLQAVKDSANYINNDLGIGKGNIKALVSGGGAKISTADFDGIGHFVRITVPLEHDAAGPATDGGLTKLDDGTLVLTAASTYNGPTTVSQGALSLTAAASLATPSVTVNSGASLDLGAASNLGALNSLDMQSGANLSLALPVSPAATVITTAAMPNTIGINYAVNAQGDSLTTGDYTVISGFTGGTPQTGIPVMTNMRAYSATATVSATDVKFNIASTGQSAANLLWSATFSDWDIGLTPAWDGPDGLFMNLDSVTFDDAGLLASAMIVNLQQTVHPAAMTIKTSSTDPWKFQGKGAIIAGTVTKTGAGEAIINNWGGIDITGSLNLVEGTFGTGADLSPVTLTSPVVFSGGAISAAGPTLTLTGVASDVGGAGLIKKGAGAVVLANTANTYTGPTQIRNGTLRVSSITDAGVASTLGASSADAANLVLGETNGATATLHYNGAVAASTNRGITLTHTTAIRTDSDLTFSGQLNGAEGWDFYKQGMGKLTFSGTVFDSGDPAKPSFGQYFGLQDGTIELTGSGHYGNNDWFNVAIWGDNTGTFIMRGDTTYTHNNVGGWGGIAIYSTGAGRMELFDNATFTSLPGNWSDFDLAYGDNANGTIILHNNAQFTMSYGWMGGVGVNSKATIELNDNSRFHVTSWANFGEANATTNIAVHGTSQLTAVDHFDFGWGANTNNTTVADGSSLIHSDAYINVGVVGANARGTVTMNENSTLSTGTSISIGYDGAGALATVNINDTADMIIGTDVYLGHGGGVKGVLNLNNNAIATVGKNISFGDYGGRGEIYVNDNAKLTAANMDMGLNWGANVTDYGYGFVTVSGATAEVTVTGVGTRGPTTGLEYQNGLIIGAVGGVGTYTQNAGTTTNINPVILGEYDWYTWDDPAADPPGGGQSPGSGTLNLNGGVFAAPAITTRSLVGLNPAATTTGVINFNGGTLKATAANADFIKVDNATAASLTLKVQAGGAKIDSNGFDIGTSLALTHDGTGTDGGLTKDGAGTLTLAGPISYDGATVINAGKLSVDNGLTTTLSTVSGAGTLVVGATNAATVVNATSINVDTLTIGGGFVAAAASVAAVPEPSTIVLLVLAGLGALLAWRRK